jgi:hypothetical protein
MTMTIAERRRNPRFNICLPVTIKASEFNIEGYTENINYNGALIQSLTGIPTPGTPCDILLYMTDDEPMEASGRVVRIVEGEKLFAVEISTIVKNGEPFLALLTGPPG